MDAVTEQVLDGLRRQREVFLELADSLGEEDWARPTADNEKWSVKDTLAHLSASDRSMASLVRAVAQGTYDVKAGQAFDLDEFNRRQVERRQETSREDLRAEMDQYRAQLLELVGGMTAAQLSEPVWTFGVDGRHGQEIPLRDRLLEYAEHDGYHAAHIRGATGR